MRAMVLDRICDLGHCKTPLRLADVPRPAPGAGEVLLEVLACGVCHTELDEIEGRTAPSAFPRILGHQAIGRIAGLGAGVRDWASGERVGVAWFYSSCGECGLCRRGLENLCLQFRATGRDHDGGYAEYMVAPAQAIARIPEVFTHAQAAPLLCAGAVGYRALRLTGLEAGQRLGLTGFGGSAHIVLQLARHQFPDTEVYVFARSEHERAFALELGAAWAGDTRDTPPHFLDAIIDTTPAWTPVVAAMRCLRPGGRLVVNAIRKIDVDKEALLGLDYGAHLWLEKEIKTVANVTRRDVAEFLAAAAEIPLRPEVREYALEDANRALIELNEKHVRGAKVLILRGA